MPSRRRKITVGGRRRKRSLELSPCLIRPRRSLRLFGMKSASEDVVRLPANVHKHVLMM
jgi:hypothetical protein